MSPADPTAGLNSRSPSPYSASLRALGGKSSKTRNRIATGRALPNLALVHPRANPSPSLTRPCSPPHKSLSTTDKVLVCHTQAFDHPDPNPLQPPHKLLSTPTPALGRPLKSPCPPLTERLPTPDWILPYPST